MSTPLRVLILEDQPADAELMLHELRQADYDPEWQRVETEADYQAGLGSEWDVILADYNLPQYDAMRALRHLQERGLDIPFIVATGSISEEVAVECMKRGATDYLLKDRLARLGPGVAQAMEKRRLREEARKAEELLRLQSTVMEAAANAIMITDRDGCIAWVNPAFTRLTGYSLTEAWGQNPRFLKSGRQDDSVYRTLWETISSGRAWSGELVNRRKDGGLYTEEMTITPVLDAQGVISHFIAIKQDVTARKRAEEAIRTLAKFPSENPNPVLRVCQEEKLLYANEASGEVLRQWGCAVGDPVPPPWGEIVREALARRRGILHDIECGDRTYSLFVAPIAEAGYVNLYGRDVTDARRAEEAVQRYVRRLEGLRGIDLAILAAESPEATAQAALGRLRDLVPCRWASVVLFEFHERAAIVLAIHTNGETRVGASTRLSLEEVGVTDEMRRGEVHLVHDAAPCDAPPPLELALRAEGIRAYMRVPLVVRGELIGSVNLGADTPGSFTPEHVEIAREVADQVAITIQQARLHEQIRRHAAELEVRVEDRTQELATANQQLQAISKHKSEFLATMSHELRTPLNSILGFSQLLLEQTASLLSEKQRRYLGHIHNSGQHLLQLINDILDISKVEAGKTVLDPQVLRVAPLLEDILVIARGLANKKAQSIKTQIAPDLPSLRADPLRFKQILFNLLSNAVKFTPEQGTITVTAKAVPGIANCRLQIADWKESDATIQSEIANAKSEIGDFLEIAVADTGIGIKAEDLPRLFQEFVQLEAGRAQGSEGTGLGLALTKKLVELHGGRIWAASPGEGQGSTFTVVLPLTGPGMREA